MMDLRGFDANQIEPNQPLDPLPAGWYRAIFTGGEERMTKAHTGSYLQLVCEVIEGDKAGRKVIEILNLNNPNQTAVEIAQRTLSGICRAIGVMTPRSSQDLMDKQFMVKVAVRAGEGTYGPSNEIKEYAPVKEYVPVGGDTKAADGTAKSSSSTPPWKRR